MSNRRNEELEELLEPPHEFWEPARREPSKMERYMAVATVTVIVYSMVIMTAVELARGLAW